MIRHGQARNESLAEAWTQATPPGCSQPPRPPGGVLASAAAQAPPGSGQQ